MGLGLVGDDHGQRGLAGTGRPPQDDGREKPVGFDGAAQELARPDDVLLADELVQRARAHPGGQGRLAFHAFLHGMGEEIHAPIIPVWRKEPIFSEKTGSCRVYSSGSSNC